MSIHPRSRLSFQHLLGLPAQILLLGFGTPGMAKEIQVDLVLEGAPGAPGSRLAAIRNPVTGAAYQWMITAGSGTLLDSAGAPAASLTGTAVRFRAGTDGVVELTCKAINEAGDTGCGTLRLALPAAGAPRAKLAIKAPDRAGLEQGPLVAWVDQPVPGTAYRWAIEGGELLTPDQDDHVLFRTGDGTKVTLTCQILSRGEVAYETSRTIPLEPSVQARGKDALAIKVSAERSFRGAQDLGAEVARADETAFSYRWHIAGGTLQGAGDSKGGGGAATGAEVLVTAGNGSEIRLLCLAKNRATGMIEATEAKITLEPALEEPRVELSDRIFQGQVRVARVLNLPADPDVVCLWSQEGLAEARPEGGQQRGSFRFRAPAAGPASLTCTVKHTKTQDEKGWSRSLTVLAPRALIDPVRIGGFTSDPPSPLRVDAKAATLSWTLDEGRAPDSLVLREAVSGREWPLKVTDRSFPLPGPLQGRYQFSLTTSCYDRDMDEQTCDTRRLELVVPGVAVLAGDAERIGSGYLKTAVGGVTPWTGVTGMAWKSPWLYLAQGSHHTIRRVRAVGGELEEVAGMRGLPRVLQEERDRLCRPGQLIQRAFKLPDGREVSDWLVLQPESHCIQAFTEGDVAATMRVLVGEFPESAAVRKAQAKARDLENVESKTETKGDSKAAAAETALHKPAAMAVHPATGHVLVADKGHRAIKLFSPMGERVRTLVRNADADGIAVNGQGDVFYTDSLHHVVRVVRNTGQGLDLDSKFAPPEIFAGIEDQSGAEDGERTGEARFKEPRDLTVAVDAAQRPCLYIADTGNNMVRKVLADPGAVEDVETFAGNRHVLKLGRTNAGLRDGSRWEAQFSEPRQLCGDGHGNLFVQDQTGPAQIPVVRVIAANGEVTTQGGLNQNTSRRGREEGKGTAAGFDRPAGLAVTRDRVIYVGDSGNRCLRRIGPDGWVAVAAGSEDKASGRLFQDDGTRASACFGGLGSLCADAEERILVQEPRFRRLRMVATRQAGSRDSSEVMTLKEDLKGDRIAIFPASAPASSRYVYAIATPLAEGGESSRCAIRIMRSVSSVPVETVDPDVPLQAFCADRVNRIWAVLAPDPLQPGLLRLRRYSCTLKPGRKAGQLVRASAKWDGEEATLPLVPQGAGRRIDGRDYAPCGVPNITAVATDSRHNLYLADAGNGTIWQVDAAMSRVSRVAGDYPYLGPLGRELDGPLPPMQAIALTPDDDVVATCGNAVLLITRPRAEAPAPWAASEILLWNPAEDKEVVKRAPAAKRPLTKLLIPEQERRWHVARSNSEKRRASAQNGLAALQAALREAEKGHRADPAAGRHKQDLEALPSVLAVAARELAFAAAEADAKQAGFEYLLLVDQGKAGGLKQKDATLLEAKADLAKAVAEARQARFEYLLEEQQISGLKPADPLRAAGQARMAWLKAIQEAGEATAERLAAEGEPEPKRPLDAAPRPAPAALESKNDGPMDIQAQIRASAEARARRLAQQREQAARNQHDPGFAQSRLGQARAREEQKRTDLVKAEQAARAFEAANPGIKLGGFNPWIAKGNVPPTD